MTEPDPRRALNRASVPARTSTRRQRALLAELTELFRTEGFIDFTLDDLAGRMHCSKSTLYTLAASKEQLAVKVVGHFFQGAAERIETQIAGIADARRLIRIYLAGVSEQLNRASTRFMRDVASFPPARSVYEMNSEVAAERIRGFIAKGVADGVFREVHATLIAEMVGMLIEGIQTGVLGTRAGVSDAEAYSALSGLLLGGVAAG